MDLSKDVLNALHDKYNMAINKGYEFEIILKDDINRHSFQNIITFLTNSKEYNLERSVNRETLDIRTVNDDNADYRLTIYGKENIQNYCKFNEISTGNHYSLIKKTRALDIKPIQIEDYNIRVNINTEDLETNSDIVSSYVSGLKNSKKWYRYKRRYTFIHKSHKIDLTTVKSSSIASVNMSKSEVLMNNEKYEVEIEAMPSDASRYKQSLADLLQTTGELLKINSNAMFLISKKEYNNEERNRG
jgi:hypothetical protein